MGEFVWGVAGLVAAAGLISDHLEVCSQKQALDHDLESEPTTLNVGFLGSARDHTSSLLHVVLGTCREETTAERTVSPDPRSYDLSVSRLKRLAPQIGSEAPEVSEFILGKTAGKEPVLSAKLQEAPPSLAAVPQRRVVLWDLPTECAELMQLDRFDVLVAVYARSVSKEDETMLAHLARSGTRCFVVLVVDADGTVCSRTEPVQREIFENTLQEMRGQNIFPFLVCAERPDMFDMQRFVSNLSAAIYSKQGGSDRLACLLCRECVCNEDEELFCEACGACFCRSCAKTLFGNPNDVDDTSKCQQLAGSEPVQCPSCLDVFTPSPRWLQWLRWLGSATTQKLL